MRFDAFAVATRSDWRKLAQYVYRKWPLPYGVEAEDIAQEMLLAAWIAIGKWDPTRCVKLQTYVVWCAVTRGKRFVHEQRNSCHRTAGDGRFPSLTKDGILSDVSEVVAWYESQDEYTVEAALLRMRARHDDGVQALIDSGCVVRDAVANLRTRGLKKREAHAVVARAIADLTTEARA